MIFTHQGLRYTLFEARMVWVTNRTPLAGTSMKGGSERRVASILSQGISPSIFAGKLRAGPALLRIVFQFRERRLFHRPSRSLTVSAIVPA